jgi:hypothetical protein
MAARFFPVKSLGTSIVGLLLSASAAHSAPAPAAPRVPANPGTEHVLFQANFQEYSPYWRQVRGQWGVVKGQLLQTRDDARELNTVMFYDPLIIADADITADAMMLTELPRFQTADDADLLRTKRMIAGAGIAFRYQDENNFYLFRLAGEDGVVLGKVVDGTWYELANPRAADFAGMRLRTDVAYRLRVRVVGNRIQCWIGDKAVANLEDGSLTTGHVGLTTFRSRAVFNSLKVVEK